jgi:RNA 3'-terminal phosphate cyclase (ATP)
MESGAAVDDHAADQMLLPAALSLDESYYLAQSATSHLLTQAAVVRQLTGRQVEIGPPNATGAVTVRVARAPD